MEELSRGDIFPKVVEAYSRPTRIVRGKEDDLRVEVFFFFLFLINCRNMETTHVLSNLIEQIVGVMHHIKATRVRNKFKNGCFQ